MAVGAHKLYRKLEVPENLYFYAEERFANQPQTAQTFRKKYIGQISKF